MKLAIDDMFSERIANELKAAGHEILDRRRPNEPTPAWMDRLRGTMIDAIVSPSRDVGRGAFLLGVYWIRIPGHHKTAEQAKKAIKNLERAKRSEIK